MEYLTIKVIKALLVDPKNINETISMDFNGLRAGCQAYSTKSIFSFVPFLPYYDCCIY